MAYAREAVRVVHTHQRKVDALGEGPDVAPRNRVAAARIITRNPKAGAAARVTHVPINLGRMPVVGSGDRGTPLLRREGIPATAAAAARGGRGGPYPAAPGV